MLFTRQIRLATFLNGNDACYRMEVCAGTVDEAETPEKAMESAVLEEIGYRAAAIHLNTILALRHHILSKDKV